MKKIYVWMAFFAIVGVSCKKLDKLTQFKIKYNESIVIASNSFIDLPFNIFTPDIESNSESEFELNDTRKDLIEEIKLLSLDLTITSPENGKYTFLKSIDVYLSAGDLEEIKVAWRDNIQNGIGPVLELETTELDLQEYIKEDKFKLKVTTVTDEVNTTDYHIDIDAVFFVNAEIAGI